MSKKVVLNADTREKLRKKSAERKKQQDAKCEYLGNVADKVFDAIEKIFEEATPVPTGGDMIEILSLVPVFVFARQIRMACKGKKAMQSVMRSSMWALTNQMNEYAAPFLNDEKPWDDIAAVEGGEDGRTESKEL